jgi:hypothetical protein
MSQKIGIAAAGVLLFCTSSFAQTKAPRYEVGFRAGTGSYNQYEDGGTDGSVLGVEGCAFCNGRFALFGGYTRFLDSRDRSADLVEAGLRIQGRRRVSPFFDIGFAAGTIRRHWYDSSFGAPSTQTMNSAGGGLGAGVAFRFARGVYIRPQARIRVMSEGFIPGSAEIAIGWRF